MKKLISIKLIIILVLNFSNVFSQEKTITGLVLDSLKIPIQYASVGILNKPIGTVTDTSGKFKLNIEDLYLLDTLKISSIGFKNKLFLIKDINKESQLNVILENYTEKLQEVVISSSNLKKYSEGKEKTNSKNKVFFANSELKNVNLGSEIGRKFTIGNNKPSVLDEFKFFIKQNNFEKVKFRINIYNIKNNIPLNRINDTDIYVNVEKSLTGWIKVDLLEYNIKANDNIIITVEWIESSKSGDTLSLPIFVPSLSSTHYYKQGAQSKWVVYKMISTAMVLTYKQ